MFLELLSDLKKKTKKAYDFQDIPFEKIVEALKTPRDTSRSPFFFTDYVNIFKFFGIII
jgi:non-ribosomal peptide synthetase component F